MRKNDHFVHSMTPRGYDASEILVRSHAMPLGSGAVAYMVTVDRSLGDDTPGNYVLLVVDNIVYDAFPVRGNVQHSRVYSAFSKAGGGRGYLPSLETVGRNIDNVCNRFQSQYQPRNELPLWAIQ